MRSEVRQRCMTYLMRAFARTRARHADDETESRLNHEPSLRVTMPSSSSAARAAPPSDRSCAPTREDAAA